MKKYLPLSLLILGSMFTVTMEKEPSSLNFFSLTSYIPSFLKQFYSSNYTPPRESELISNLHAHKNALITQLEPNETIKFTVDMLKQMSLFTYKKTSLFDQNTIDNNPVQFLQYCYYQAYHKNSDIFTCMNINELDNYNPPHFLKKCQDIRIDGYSALGAAMLAPNINFKKQRQFIQKELINRNFKPTPNDIQLAKLIFYDEIIKEEQSVSLKTKKSKTKFLYLLHKNSPASWSVLPQEVRQLIAYFMLEVLKKEENYWLLPGF